MWRPDKWPKCPCDGCTHKAVDNYGYLCNMTCGKRSEWVSFEAGASLMFEVLKKQPYEEKDEKI